MTNTIRPLEVAGRHEAIERLVQLLEQENRALREGKFEYLARNNEHKAQATLELSLALSDPSAWRDHPLTLEKLELLQKCLKDNSRLLEKHLGAIQEIAETIASSIRDGEHDGTYSRAIL